jgi:uncharacterized protein
MNVTLCLTHDCNLRCTYCYAGRKQGKRMAWETAKRTIDYAFEHAVGRAALTGRAPEAQLGYFGGEPLLEWDLLKRSSAYADEAAARLGLGLRKTVTTNMTLLDVARIGWLRENAFYVGLSLDGNAAMHDTLRRFPDGSGSHAACIRMLEHFAGPDACAEVIVVVDPRNVAHLAESVEWLMARDIRSIALNPNFYIAWPDGATRRSRVGTAAGSGVATRLRRVCQANGSPNRGTGPSRPARRAAPRSSSPASWTGFSLPNASARVRWARFTARMTAP